MVRVQSVAARNACNKRALANIIGERDGVIIRKANQADFTDEAWREVQIVKFCKEVSIMDKKTFKTINKKFLLEYGFDYFNKNYYLNLPNIIICVQYIAYPFGKGQMLAYNIIIKELSNIKTDSLPAIEQAFDDLSEIPVQMPVLIKLEVRVSKGKVANVFEAEEIDEHIWSTEFLKTLHEVFDPFKKNGLGWMHHLVYESLPEKAIIVNSKVEEYLSEYRNQQN